MDYMNTTKTLIIGLVVVVAVAIGGFFFWTPAGAPETLEEARQESQIEAVTEGAAVVAPGTYVVVPAESMVQWAGKKPLIEGYVNSGSIGLNEGTITVTDTAATGNFTIDMNTLSVSETPTKPGKESALEGHLKGEGWFDVAAFPTATFEIVEVSPRVDSAATFIYGIRGNLTMKGETHELSFPATIYLDGNGALHADASLEFDRTVWGITAGSGSFFDNLADNAIDDMVALSFKLVAEKQ